MFRFTYQVKAYPHPNQFSPYLGLSSTLKVEASRPFETRASEQISLHSVKTQKAAVSALKVI